MTWICFGSLSWQPEKFTVLCLFALASRGWLELEPRPQFLSQCAALTVLAYKVDIIAEPGACSYRPCVLPARQGRSISVCCLAQREPADSAVPAGDSVPFSGGCCKWLQLGFDISIPPCVRPTGRAE